jgi:hypothetical protein
MSALAIIAAVVVIAALAFFLVGNLRRPVPDRHQRDD